jgi:hypothetical protein
MWTREQAKAAVEQHLRSTGAVGDDEVVILDASTIERSYGWVFVYQSKRFLETGDIMDALGGNGPIVALRTSETLHPLATSASVDVSLRAFEDEHGLPHA